MKSTKDSDPSSKNSMLQLSRQHRLKFWWANLERLASHKVQRSQHVFNIHLSKIGRLPIEPPSIYNKWFYSFYSHKYEKTKGPRGGLSVNGNSQSKGYKIRACLIFHIHPFSDSASSYSVIICCMLLVGKKGRIRLGLNHCR